MNSFPTNTAIPDITDFQIHSDDDNDLINFDNSFSEYFEVTTNTINDDLDDIELSSYANYENNAKKNTYVSQLLASCDLHVFHSDYVLQQFKEKGEVFLFHLFLKKTWLTNYVRKITQANLQTKNYNKKTVSNEEILAITGLEIALSICGNNTLRDTWDSSNLFSGHQDFQKIMSFYVFSTIRSSIGFVSHDAAEFRVNTTDGSKKSQVEADPLFTVRPALEHFWHNCVAVAVPLGVVALDENGCATRARTRAKTYLPSKPQKYAIRFYALVGYAYNYLFSMFDNGAGNESTMNPARRYCNLHTTMNKCYRSAFIDKSIPSKVPVKQSTRDTEITEIEKTSTSSLSLGKTSLVNCDENSDTDTFTTADAGTTAVRKRKRKKSSDNETKETFVSKESASALWTMMIAHMSRVMPMSKSNVKSNERIVVTDNYYTRRQMAAQMDDIDEELINMGTVRSNFIDDVNKFFYDKAKAEFLKHAKTGDWCLLPAFHPHPDHEKHKSNHKKFNEYVMKERKRRNKMKMGTYDESVNKKQKLAKYEQQFRNMSDENLRIEEFIPDTTYQIPNAGYILFLDGGVVSMYHSKLADTPKKYAVFSYHEDEKNGKQQHKSNINDVTHAIKCVHGLGPFERWSDNKISSKTIYQVPSIVLAYNIFMNTVDVMDQMRSVNVTKRKEKHVHMSVWTMILDLACHNAFSIYRWIRDKHPDAVDNNNIHKNLKDFKRKIAVALVTPYMQLNAEKKGNMKNKEVVELHHQLCTLEMLPSGKKRAQVVCKLCFVLGKKIGKTKKVTSQTITYCNKCNNGYHPMCFEIFHNLDKYPDVKERLMEHNLISKMKEGSSNTLSIHAKGKIYYPFDN